MSKVGNYIVGASVVAIMAGSPVEAEAHNNYGDDNTNDKDKVVYVEENLRDSLKNDNTIAWEMVANNEQELRNATSSNQTKEELKEELREDSWSVYETIREIGRAPRIENLQYQNDTISVEQLREMRQRREFIADAYYTYNRNTITDNIYEGEVEQSRESTLSILAHEAEHMHQYEKVNFSADMSLGQHYKLHCYKEIGAQVAGLLQLREMYKEASTDADKNNIIKNGLKRYPEYFTKIKNGEIDPSSDKKEDFDNEMSLIINSTTNKWMRSCAGAYDKTHVNMVLSDTRDSSIEPNDKNYKEGVSVLLTIGGIDFSQYLDEDIKCYNESIRVVDEKVKNGEDVKVIRFNLISNDKYDPNYVGIEFNEVEGCEGFSLEQRYNLAVQKAFADKIKDAGLADLASMSASYGGDPIDTDVKNITNWICENNDVFASSAEFALTLSENKGFVKKASDKEYLEKLREIWSIENSKGEKVCLLDAMTEVPDFKNHVASDGGLKRLDERPFLEKIRDSIRYRFKNDDNKIMDSVSEDMASVSINDVKPLEKPNYTSSPSRSDVLLTSEVIDTRSDYLAEERAARIEEATKTMNESFKNIHPKTETVDLNRQRLNDELSSIQPKTEKVNTGSEVLIALAQQGRGM